MTSHHGNDVYIDEFIFSRVLGDELFEYCYFSCLNVTYVQMSFLVVTFDLNTPPTCYNAYWSTMNLLIVYIPVSDCHTIQYTVHEHLPIMRKQH